MPDGFREEAGKIGLQSATTTVYDNYLMFVKPNLKLSVSPTDRPRCGGESEIVHKTSPNARECTVEWTDRHPLKADRVWHCARIQCEGEELA